jgi:hypothetical protein
MEEEPIGGCDQAPVQVNLNANPIRDYTTPSLCLAQHSMICREVTVNDRLSQDNAGRLILAGHVLKIGEDVEVIVGGNWHRALVRHNREWSELILDNGRLVVGVGLTARLLAS